MRSVLLASVFLTGCSAILPSNTLESHGTLTFADQARLPCFASVDGQDLRTAPTTIYVKPGERRVRYFCAVRVDGPPTPLLELNVEAGKTYVLHCKDDTLASVEER